MMSKKPRVKLPKSAQKGEIVEVKTLATHDMETGNRKGKDGNKIPRLILNKFTCSFGGKEIFSADMHPSVSANPYIAFNIRAESSGEYTFTWIDDNKEVTEVKETMTVS
ncbi:MAG: thiosulfate oxidation carrier complex protein SoxZ [Alphaproteobacteria bacterium]|nr:thiosulfate oxidation carrier complex protein SoxZ [Alphaproteobacteria bacterium]